MAARAAQKIGMNAGAHDGQLREAAGAERRGLDGGCIHHVAGGGVRLVHQRRANDVHLGRHLSDLQTAVDGGGAVAVDQDFGVAFGVESLLGEGELIGARRQIRNRIRAGGLLNVR